jgi:hypothetical protein
MEGLPAMAQLLHGYLQQPVSRWSRLGNEGVFFGRLVAECHAMVRDTTVASWGLELVTGCSVSQHQHHQHQNLQQQQQQQQGSMPAGQEAHPYISGSAMHKVRCWPSTC